VICGYSLTFGTSILGGFVGWNPDYFFLRGIDETITNGIPEYIIAMFQGKFAIITPALISGALAERVYLRGYILFISLWFLAVYSPLCHWIWAPDGWLFIEGFLYKKASALGFASGTLAGLVVITPAAAVVQPVGAMVLGSASALVCFYALQLKIKLGYDDTLDCFGIHGVGSGLGVILLCFFIRDSWLASASEAAGRTWTVFDQLLIQLKGMGVTILLAGTATFIICLVVDKTVGFRLDQEKEFIGMDQALHGERGYDFT